MSELARFEPISTFSATNSAIRGRFLLTPTARVKDHQLDSDEDCNPSEVAGEDYSSTPVITPRHIVRPVNPHVLSLDRDLARVGLSGDFHQQQKRFRENVGLLLPSKDRRSHQASPARSATTTHSIENSPSVFGLGGQAVLALGVSMTSSTSSPVTFHGKDLRKDTNMKRKPRVFSRFTGDVTKSPPALPAVAPCLASSSFTLDPPLKPSAQRFHSSEQLSPMETHYLDSGKSCTRRSTLLPLTSSPKRRRSDMGINSRIASFRNSVVDSHDVIYSSQPSDDASSTASGDSETGIEFSSSAEPTATVEQSDTLEGSVCFEPSTFRTHPVDTSGQLQKQFQKISM